MATATHTLTEEEAAGAAGVVALSTDLARALAPDSNASALLGDSVLLGGTPVVVVGILEPAPRPPVPMASRRRPQSDYRVLAPLRFAATTTTPGQPPARGFRL